MKRYDSYKDSGVEWIGEVPSHWEVLPLKFKSDIIMGQSPDGKDIVPFGKTLFMQGNADFNNYYPTPNMYCDSCSKYSRINDILMSVRAPVGELNFSDKIYGIGRGLCSIKGVDVYQKYLWYYLQMTKDIYKYFETGSTFTAITISVIKNLKLIDPSKEEQHKIAYYLDTKCGEVDKVISTQEKRIALLQELKQSIITHAVTKGLNPDVKMKDSGIEWIGEVPEHWVIMRVKDLLRLLTDYDANGSFADIAKNCNINNGNPYAWMVRATDLENNRIGIVDGNNYCDKKTYEYLSKSSLSVNDILLAKRGDIGKSYLVPFCNDPMTLAPNTYLLLTDKKKVNNKCLFYYFQSYVGAEILRLLNKSTTLGALYKDDVKSINVPIAPLLEQQEIASYLDKRCAQIDASICKAQKEIELLQEYKQSLITEVVTGKRKVC